MFAVNIILFDDRRNFTGSKFKKHFKFETLGRIFFWSNCSRDEQF